MLRRRQTDDGSVPLGVMWALVIEIVLAVVIMGLWALCKGPGLMAF